MSTEPLTALQEGLRGGAIAVLLFMGLVLVAIGARYIHEVITRDKP